MITNNEQQQGDQQQQKPSEFQPGRREQQIPDQQRPNKEEIKHTPSQPERIERKETATPGREDQPGKGNEPYRRNL